jgi:hypothetical protein
MNLKAIPFGVIGSVLALGGITAYHFSPEQLWLVTAVESLALVCLILFLKPSRLFRHAAQPEWAPTAY